MTADEVRDLRRKAGLTQQGLAFVIGASISSVKNWESNSRNHCPTGLYLKALQDLKGRVDAGEDLKGKLYMY